MGKRSKLNRYGIYSILFIVVSLVVFSPFLLRGNSFVPNADGYNQTFPVFVYCRKFWLNLLQGNVKTFDFAIGLGDDVFFTLGWPGLFDLVSIVSSILFPKQLIEYAYGFSVLLKLYLAGISFMLYADKHVKTNEYMVLGALLYSFNIYELFWGMNWAPFLYAPIILPLILLGIDKMCEGERLSIWMIVALCAQGLNGFYLLYIEILIAIIYFCFVAFFRLYKEKNYSLKKIIGTTGRITINGCLGVLLSSVTLFPTIAGLFLSTREVGGEVFSQRLFCGLKQFVSSVGDLFIPDVYDNVTTLPFLLIGGMVTYLFMNKGKKEFKYLSIVIFLLIWCPIWGSITNGFSYSGNRWLFVVSFFTSMATILALDSKEEIPVISWNICKVVLLISLIIHFVQSEKSIGLYIRLLVFCGLAIGLKYVWNTHKEKVILYYACLTVMCLGLFTFGPKILGGCGYSANFKEWGTYDEIKNSACNLQREDDLFERWDIYDSSLAASLVTGYYGTSEYFSMLNANVSDFFQELYISPGVKVASFILRGLDSRQELMSLLSVSKYMDFETDKGQVHSFINENMYYIPLGFTYDTYIREEEFRKLNPMDKSSQLLKTIVLEENNSILKHGLASETDSVEINYNVKELKDKKFRIYLKGLDLENKSNEKSGELYVSIADLHGNGYLYVGNKEVELKNPLYEYYTGIDEYWIHVTEVFADSEGCYFDVYFDGYSDLDLDELNLYWHEIDYQAISERKHTCLKNIQIDNNMISGEIIGEKDELLFLSIPYSKGWKAYIDEKEVDILKANIGFMAVPLTRGNHEICLVYETPGLQVGIVCSAISFFVIIFIYIWMRKKRCD